MTIHPPPRTALLALLALSLLALLGPGCAGKAVSPTEWEFPPIEHARLDTGDMARVMTALQTMAGNFTFTTGGYAANDAQETTPYQRIAKIEVVPFRDTDLGEERMYKVKVYDSISTFSTARFATRKEALHFAALLQYARDNRQEIAPLEKVYVFGKAEVQINDMRCYFDVKEYRTLISESEGDVCYMFPEYSVMGISDFTDKKLRTEKEQQVTVRNLDGGFFAFAFFRHKDENKVVYLKGFHVDDLFTFDHYCSLDERPYYIGFFCTPKYGNLVIMTPYTRSVRLTLSNSAFVLRGKSWVGNNAEATNVIYDRFGKEIGQLPGVDLPKDIPEGAWTGYTSPILVHKIAKE